MVPLQGLSVHVDVVAVLDSAGLEGDFSACKSPPQQACPVLTRAASTVLRYSLCSAVSLSHITRIPLPCHMSPTAVSCPISPPTVLPCDAIYHYVKRELILLLLFSQTLICIVCLFPQNVVSHAIFWGEVLAGSHVA